MNNKINDTIKKLSELDLWYIPIIVLVLLLLIGFWTGFWRGWKSALYFFVWNIAGFIAALFIFDAIYEKQLVTLAKKFAGSIEDKIGTAAFNDTLKLFKGWIVLMLVLVALTVWNFIAWLVHLFFKKHFQKQLKLNKELGKSNASSRLVGGLLGTLTVIPSAVAAMASSTIFTNNAGVNKFIDKTTSAITFGKTKTVAEDWDAIYALVLSANHASDLVDVLTKPNVDQSAIDNVKANADTIKSMLENPKSAALVQDIVAHVMDGKTKPTAADLSSATGVNGVLSGLSIDGQQTLINVLKAVVAPSGDAVADETAIKSFVAKLTQA